MDKKEKIFLGQGFIDTVLANVESKEAMTTHAVTRYLMRAAMAGIIVTFGYLMYLAFNSNYAQMTFGGTTLEPMGKVISGCFFSLCLVSIYYSKSELLTSNMMMTCVAKYYNKLTTKGMFKIMGLCLLGNFLGGLFVAALIGPTDIINSNMVEVMNHSLEAKQGYVADGHIFELLIRALFCNFFINLSMLMVYSGNIKDDAGKVVVIFFGVMIFMYLGLEHSVANTLFFTVAAGFELFHAGATEFDALLAIQNVLWVLVGNFIGGGLCIGVYYAYINDSRKFVEKNSK